MRKRERVCVVVRTHLCRDCHRLLLTGELGCGYCGGFNTASIRCRVNKSDLPAFKRAYKHRYA